MNQVKYSIICLFLIFSYVLPLGGINVGGGFFQSSTSISDTESNFIFEGTSGESPALSGMIAIYYDLLPMDLSAEISFEATLQQLESTISFDGTQLANEAMYSTKQATYFTIKKQMLGVSIPFLAKAGISLGAGYNTHSSILPSIGLLKDLFNQNDLTQLFADLENSGENIFDNLNDLDLADYSQDSNGFHIQAGLEGRLLVFNMILNARYTFVELPSSDDSGFLSFNMMLGYGI